MKAIAIAGRIEIVCFIVIVVRRSVMLVLVLVLVLGRLGLAIVIGCLLGLRLIDDL